MEFCLAFFEELLNNFQGVWEKEELVVVERIKEAKGENKNKIKNVKKIAY